MKGWAANGYFQLPFFDSLSKVLVIAQDRGAIAVDIPLRLEALRAEPPAQ